MQQHPRHVDGDAVIPSSTGLNSKDIFKEFTKFTFMFRGIFLIV